MKIATLSLESVSAYCQSKYVTTPKKEKESSQAYEERTWRDRLHTTEDGQVFIPPLAFKNCLAEAAKYLKISIPGEGKATYTKHFEAGILVLDPLLLPLRKEEVECDERLVPSDGRVGGGTRVIKYFPLIPKWKGEVVIYVLDEKITKSVLENVVKEAGKFIGIGAFRPRNRGIYGRFKLTKMQWEESSEDM